MRYQVLEFRTARGDKVIKKFLERQSAKVQARALKLIDMLKYGPNLGLPYSKKVHPRVFELRVTGKLAVRILYSFKGNKIYLLHGFKKKTQKIPRKEIELALRRLTQI